MKIAGLIIAGGRGTRMGSEKPFLPFRGAHLIDAVIARAEPQIDRLAINSRPDQGPVFRARYPGFRLVPDLNSDGAGPLSGILAGLSWLTEESTDDWLATFPCDTPFLPLNLVEVLAGAAQPSGDPRPVVAIADERLQSLCAIWPRAALARIRDGFIDEGWKSVREALNGLGAIQVSFGGHAAAFFNINTPEDLAEAEKRAAAQALS